MIAHLQEAARKARTAASLIGDDVQIVMMVTEIGLVVAGENANPNHRYTTAIDYDWAEIEANPALPMRGVELVAHRIRQFGAASRKAVA
jgi:hypothetical protein